MNATLPDALKKAINYYKKGSYALCISLLEGQILHFRDSPFFYRLLGFCCLRTNDFGGGETYLQRALQLDPNDIESRLGLAYLQLKKGQSTKALQLWLEVIEEMPKNPQAQRGLQGLRKHQTPEAINFWLASPKTVKTLIPTFTGPQIPLRPFLILGSAVLITALAFLIPWTKLINQIFPKTDSTLELPKRSGVELTDLSGLDQLTSLSGSYSQILTEREIRESFTELKANFSNFQDNKAQLLINKILLSNADSKVKERVATLESFIKPPDFVSFRDNFTYGEVYKNPQLYNKCYIKWKGAIANIISSEKGPISMDLLVGYEEGKLLEGIAKLSVNFAYRPESGMAVEVLGRVAVDQKKWFLEVQGIHPIGLRKNE